MDVLGTLQEALGRDCYRLDAAKVSELQQSLELDTDALLRSLVDYGKARARAPVSDFHVGTAGLTESGEIFLGVNLEYLGASFSQTIHAEQFLLSWSRSCSGSPLKAIAVSAPPCGHCRQFLREADPEGAMRLLIGQEPDVPAASLLPRAFTPVDLGIEQPFYAGPLDLEGCDVEEAARRASEQSYTPYSGAKAGLALRVRDGRIFAGSALENAAYNPTLPPLQAALICCHAHSVELSDIEEIVLSEQSSKVSYQGHARALAETFGLPHSAFRVV